MKTLWIGLFCLCICALTGIITVENSWKKAIHSQWKADHELALDMIEFRDKMNTIESANWRMKALRAAIVAALGIRPEAIPALRTALTAESAIQRVRLATWTVKQVSSLGSLGILPSLPWSAVPPDVIGEKPLAATSEPLHQEKFYGSMRVQQRRSDVVVYKKQNQLWHARYITRPSII